MTTPPKKLPIHVQVLFVYPLTPDIMKTNQFCSLFLQSSQQRIIVKGGKVVNEDGFQDADVYIEEGIIR